MEYIIVIVYSVARALATCIQPWRMAANKLQCIRATSRLWKQSLLMKLQGWFSGPRLFQGPEFSLFSKPGQVHGKM